MRLTGETKDVNMRDDMMLVQRRDRTFCRRRRNRSKVLQKTEEQFKLSVEAGGVGERPAVD